METTAECRTYLIKGVLVTYHYGGCGKCPDLIGEKTISESKKPVDSENAGQSANADKKW